MDSRGGEGTAMTARRRQRGLPVSDKSHAGDGGETGLIGGGQVSKDSPRPEACGTVDELVSAIGMARAEGLDASLDAVLERVQTELFCVGSELATPDPAQNMTPPIGPEHVAWLEDTMAECGRTLPALRSFILPGGNRAAAGLHLARAICRRAERRVVALDRQSEPGVSPSLRAYLNRLSDLLFVLARKANASAGLPDVPWRPQPPR
jgi:cob(I)alamin adenosyltransferase